MAEANPKPDKVADEPPLDDLRQDTRTFSNTIVFHELTCAAERFDQISRMLWLLFYLLGTTQILISTFTTLLRLNHQEGQIPAVVLMLLDTTASFLAVLVIFIPFSATAKSCDRAYSLASSFALSGVPVPMQVINYVAETTTLCFKHPLAYRDCKLRDPYYGYGEERLSDSKKPATESIQMVAL